MDFKTSVKALDFQLYLITPFILILYRYRKWAGYLSAVFLVLASWGAQFGYFMFFPQTLYGTMVGAANAAWCVPPPEEFSQEKFYFYRPRDWISTNRRERRIC